MLLLGAVRGKGYENKPKFRLGGGGGFYSWSGYKKNCKFFLIHASYNGK